MAYYLFRAIDAETGKRIYGAYLEDRDVIVDANGVFHKFRSTARGRTRDTRTSTGA